MFCMENVNVFPEWGGGGGRGDSEVARVKPGNEARVQHGNEARV